MSEQSELSYFDQRMNILGITPEINKVMLWAYDAETKTNQIQEKPVFSEVDKGIFIRCFSIDRMPITYAKEGSRHKVNDYGITRLEEPIIKKDGSLMKYNMPKGVPVVPFFPPQLLDKYDNKTAIPVLYITEGYFKAFKAQMHGIDCIGLPSITCMKEKETGKLHGDIHKLIARCAVERIIWLVDGDCRNITGKEITDGIDLYKRPKQFFNTAYAFHDLLSSYENVKKYFAHINSDNFDDKPKGIDDLLCAYPDDTKAIVKEFRAFDKIKETGTYLVKFDVTYGTGNVYKYFMLHDVDVFYLFHLERRNELKGKDFTFNGTLYHYEESQGKCIVKVPSNAANYFRVGDKYYEYVNVPNRYGQLQAQYHRREKETIKEDNTRDIFKHIPKYKAFCTVPDHVSYQRVINNCFNLYFPLEWEPEQGDCETTLSFIKHIFGTEKIQVSDTLTVERWELGLDYLTILYKVPQQILPILCLVSTERQTGKTTFAKWLNMMFTENMAIVGNDDLGAQFNAHWASKLIVACDETKIDKHIVMEKIKSLSTASNIMMNAKGRDQISMEFFAKFILMSNNEDNFATIDKEEIRFWVIKVPSIRQNNVDLIEDMKEEIPAFLHYLNQRKMVTERKERHWFDSRLLRTEALEKVVQNSRPNVEKLIIHAITELFEATALPVIYMPLQAIATDILKRPNDKNYIGRVMDGLGYKLMPSQRREYPRFTEEHSTDEHGNKMLKQSTIPVRFHNRHYEFKRADFVRDESPGIDNNADDSLPF